MKTIVQYLASWYWQRMRRVERKLWELYDNALTANWDDMPLRRRALRLKDKAETLDRWARWWGA